MVACGGPACVAGPPSRKPPSRRWSSGSKRIMARAMNREADWPSRWRAHTSFAANASNDQQPNTLSSASTTYDTARASYVFTDAAPFVHTSRSLSCSELRGSRRRPVGTTGRRTGGQCWISTDPPLCGPASGPLDRCPRPGGQRALLRGRGQGDGSESVRASHAHGLGPPLDAAALGRAEAGKCGGCRRCKLDGSANASPMPVGDRAGIESLSLSSRSWRRSVRRGARSRDGPLPEGECVGCARRELLSTGNRGCESAAAVASLR
jgi:hypothetical protein